jgi:hydroxypyruvate isomerase
VPIKQSFCYPLFRPKGMSLDELLARAAEIGYAGVELWRRGDDFEQLVEAAHRHNLTVAHMNGHQSLTDGSNNRANHDRIEAELTESIDLAAEHGIPGLNCLSGNRLDGLDDEQAVGVAADCYKRVVGHAEDKGVNLNLELLNSKRDHGGYQCDHTAWGVAVCRKVASPRMKLNFDIYHMQIMEGDLIETIRANIEHIGHFHTAGNPGRGPLDETQEIYYPAVCRAIADAGYDLYVGHEFGPRGDRLAALEAAFRTCYV